MENFENIKPGKKYKCIKNYYLMNNSYLINNKKFLEFKKGKNYTFKIPPTLPKNSYTLGKIYLKGESGTYRSFSSESNINFNEYFLNIEKRRRKIIDIIINI